MQRFVRALVVVFLPKPIEAHLLGLEIGAGGTCRLGFQRAMHPLVAPVLLRRGRRDQLGEDPQPNPPHRQRRQAPERGRREEHALSVRMIDGKPYS